MLNFIFIFYFENFHCVQCLILRVSYCFIFRMCLCYCGRFVYLFDFFFQNNDNFVHSICLFRKCLYLFVVIVVFRVSYFVFSSVFSYFFLIFLFSFVLFSFSSWRQPNTRHLFFHFQNFILFLDYSAGSQFHSLSF